jgi:hypothetical protein
MNEAASDSESSDSETCPKLSQGMNRRKSGKNVQRSSSLMSHRSTALNNNPYSSRPLSVAKSVMDRTERGEFFRILRLIDEPEYENFALSAERPATLALNVNDASDNNFFTQQARLQIEARMALAQAKDIAHMQMEVFKYFCIIFLIKKLKMFSFTLTSLNAKSSRCVPSPSSCIKPSTKSA